MSKSIIALALLAASSTALLDVHKQSNLRRRLGKGKYGGGKSGSKSGSKSGYDEDEDEDDCSCDAAYEELELCKENNEACQDELKQCSEQIEIIKKECASTTNELQSQVRAARIDGPASE